VQKTVETESRGSWLKQDNRSAEARTRVEADYAAAVMPRDGAIIFGDLIAKLDVLHVACDKCGRKGRYAVVRLSKRWRILRGVA
jgi:hypothetical protein